MFPILNLTLRTHGLSNAEISLSNIILPFLVFLTSPLVGFIADKSRRFRLTFNISLLVVILAVTGLFLLPPIKSHSIQARLHPVSPSQYALDFCASQEIITQCTSRSECGCSYRARCKTGNITFSFLMEMNSFSTEKEFNEKEELLCELKYRVPIENARLNDKLG